MLDMRKGTSQKRPQLSLVILFLKVTFIGLVLSYCKKLYMLIVENLEDTEKQKKIIKSHPPNRATEIFNAYLYYFVTCSLSFDTL